MPRLVGIRAHRKVDPVGEPRARRPDLVAVDHPRVAAPRRPSGQRRQVAPGTRLREALAEGQLTASDRAEQALLQLGRGVALERAADRLVREEVERQRQPVVPENILDQCGVDVREAAAAELLGPRHARSNRLRRARASPPASRRRRAFPDDATPDRLRSCGRSAAANAAASCRSAICPSVSRRSTRGRS